MRETTKTKIDRYYELLYRQLVARIPSPTNPIHIYSKGAMIRGFFAEKTVDGYKFTISRGIDYGDSALGFLLDGSRNPNPRGELEAYNFKIVDQCIDSVSKLVCGKGGLNVNGRTIY